MGGRCRRDRREATERTGKDGVTVPHVRGLRHRVRTRFTHQPWALVFNISLDVHVHRRIPKRGDVIRGARSHGCFPPSPPFPLSRQGPPGAGRKDRGGRAQAEGRGSGR